MASAPRKRPAPKRPPRPTPRSDRARSGSEDRDSSPEIEVGFAPAGQKTLAAITEALSPRETDGSTPDIEFSLMPAGRETLAAITAEIEPRMDEPPRPQEKPQPGPRTGPRQRLRTRGYSEPPPSEVEPSAQQADKLSRATLDAIGKAVLEPVPSSRRSAGTALEVFELLTFVVRGDDLAQLSSEATRRELVAERLLQRLPVATMDQVDRIDVTPWTVSGTLRLRVWCRVKMKR